MQTWGGMFQIFSKNNNPKNLRQYDEMYNKKTKDMTTLSSSISKCTLPTNPATAKSVIVGQECIHISDLYTHVTFKKIEFKPVDEIFHLQMEVKYQLDEPSSDALLPRECADGRLFLFGKTK